MGQTAAARITGLTSFRMPHYLRLNEARLSHLASLGLPLENRTVLELGSGPGDLTGFYLARNCEVTSVDARAECLEPLVERYPMVKTVQMDLNFPEPLRDGGSWEVIHCYGILYHLEKPENLVAVMRDTCSGFCVIETCVSLGRQADVVAVEEVTDYTQSITNKGSRPTRRWVFEQLKIKFPFVYLTRTQPANPEFPTEWTVPLDHLPIVRSIFVASQRELPLATLSPTLLDVQQKA